MSQLPQETLRKRDSALSQYSFRSGRDQARSLHPDFGQAFHYVEEGFRNDVSSSRQHLIDIRIVVVAVSVRRRKLSDPLVLLK